MVQTAWTTEGVTAPVGEFLGIPYAQTPKRFEVAKLTAHNWTVRTRRPCDRNSAMVQAGRDERAMRAWEPLDDALRMGLGGGGAGKEVAERVVSPPRFARVQRPRTFRSLPPVCPQNSQNNFYKTQSEDCLFLNIFAPKEPLAHAQIKSATPALARAPELDAPARSTRTVSPHRLFARGVGCCSSGPEDPGQLGAGDGVPARWQIRFHFIL